MAAVLVPYLAKPAVEHIHVKPSRFGCPIGAARHAALRPVLIHSASATLVDDHGWQHVARRAAAEHDGEGYFRVVAHLLKIL